jgi:serine/threonine-protein kinase
MSARSVIPLLIASLLLVPAVARAGDPVAAQALFEEAKRLMKEERYAQACPKFEESQKMDPGLGTQFHLANCWQHIGRTASAWALFREVESEARALGQVGRERVARDRAAALEPWLSKVEIAVHGAGDAPGVEIRRDGVEVGREQWNVPVPVDPGTHVVTMTAPNKQLWKTTVDVLPNSKIAMVDLPPLADVPDLAVTGRGHTPSESGVALVTGVTSPMPPDVGEIPVLENRGSAQRAIGWLFVGAGVAGLATGVYFGAKWLDERGSSDPHCIGNTCDPVGMSLRSDARTQARYAEVALGVSGGSLLIGTVLVATAPRPRIVISGAKLEIEPMVSPKAGGLRIGGAW